MKRTPGALQHRAPQRIGLQAGGDVERHPVDAGDQFEASGSRIWRSSTMRAGERFSSPGSRTVSAGSSSSAVPMPTSMAVSFGPHQDRLRGEQYRR
jgi:hypothetical protein